MGKTVFMFPGQGAQYIGMGKDFYEIFPCAKEVYDLAFEVTGIQVDKLCFEENELLNETRYTQIAMLTTEAAILQVLKEVGKNADVSAGLSLGEYGALLSSGVISYEDAFKVVKNRGIFMQEAYPQGGAMSAVLGLDYEKIESVCKSIDGIVSIANYNCPGQIVITGECSAVMKASEALKEAGAKRIVPLKVSGPFHSLLLKEAGNQLADTLKDVEILDFKIPYVANVNADYVTKKEEVKDLLIKQVSSSVRWQQTIEKLIADGYDTFVEIGPGKTLSGFMKKINRDVSVYSIATVEEFNYYVNQ